MSSYHQANNKLLLDLSNLVCCVDLNRALAELEESTTPFADGPRSLECITIWNTANLICPNVDSD